MPKIEISPLRGSERSRWSELWSAYQRFYGVELPDQVTDSTWYRIHAGRIQALGARDASERLVGIAHFLYHEDTCPPRPPVTCRIWRWMRRRAPRGRTAPIG